MAQTGKEDEAGAALKTCLSTDKLELDLDALSDVSSELSFGFEFAQREVMMKGMGSNGGSNCSFHTRCFLFLHPAQNADTCFSFWSSDPLQSVLQTLERQHEEEKRCALERQRLLYEHELQLLRQQLTPDKSPHFRDASGLPVGASASTTSLGPQKRVRRWSEDRCCSAS